MSEADEEERTSELGSSELARGALVGERYRILRKLGEGGMGVVYLAEHVHIQKRVALKVLASRLSHLSRYDDSMGKEARTAARVQHEHVVDITDSGRTPDGLVFFVMQHLEGRSLADELYSGGAMPLARVLRIARQIIAGVEAAHELDVIHRDLKPDNIFLVTQGGTADFVKILDFGLATVRAVGERRGTGGGNAVGTPEYMSPEQARAEPPDRSFDTYALACVFYEMLTGSPPFAATAAIDVLVKQINEQPTPPSLRAPEHSIPAEIDAVLLRALEKDRAKRFSSLRRFAAALEDAAAAALASTGDRSLLDEVEGSRAAAAQLLAQRTEPDQPPMAAPRRRRGLGLALLGGALLLLAGGTAVLWRSDAWQARGELERIEARIAKGPLLGSGEGSAAALLRAASARFPGRSEWTRAGEALTEALKVEAGRALAARQYERAGEHLREALLFSPGDAAVARDLQLATRGAFALGSGMVPVEGFFIDRYEYPNLQGRAPMTSVDFSAAAELCRGAGKRLCTEPEWERACAGSKPSGYPYGSSYLSRRCVTQRPVSAGPSPAGASAACESADGVRDLSGNVAEWTSSPFNPGAPQMAVRGGSWADGAARVGCKSRDYFLPGVGGAPTVGFRCCY